MPFKSSRLGGGVPGLGLSSFRVLRSDIPGMFLTEEFGDFQEKFVSIPAAWGQRPVWAMCKF